MELKGNFLRQTHSDLAVAALWHKDHLLSHKLSKGRKQHTHDQAHNSVSPCENLGCLRLPGSGKMSLEVVRSQGPLSILLLVRRLPPRSLIYKQRNTE